ncbi:uncharacterized protein FOMMEDRAFT_143581 [Fomitiporia mediterranea MF3/22]|uniref:uncharacterized protein n=1 Tax=Fomitiporia mediterranea (strain MF3/22) TaxID=694068 RepID=UPI0004408305|nr:uncharacterized protein FOMMEDRAFT_143581 [Fomitiporia mediterranea MF3/22]EJC98148.1 hypothetical protein FOMMEDRAFT_143581 [Fomitiporia mediterranea MF3/22]
MALTASPQSALQDFSWDEAIVPTLRKRLENESRALSKRMSNVPAGVEEDGTIGTSKRTAPRTSASSNRTGGRVTPSSTSTERPSAIPRPSLNYSRPNNATSSQGNNKSDKSRPGQQRSRTFSTPYAFDPSLTSTANGPNGHSTPPPTRTTDTSNALPTPASSRSNSPSMPSPPVLETRNARNTKTSGNKRADPNGRTTPTYNRPMNDEYDYGEHGDWDADEDTYDASYSSINVNVPQGAKTNGILQEAPPFSANSSFASDVEVRPSLEERPYEHWYRGDLSRNGGVGELRIGNRMEMLEIASYGHKLRKIRNDTLSRQRRRAESIGHRESVVFDDEPDNAAPLVLDETPLTDMEVDTEHETDREMSLPRPQQSSLEQPKRTARSEAQPSRTVALPSTPKHRQPSQIPRATPNAPRTNQRTASEPLQQKPLSSSTSSVPPSRSGSSANPNTARIPNPQSQGLPSTPAQKRGRAKSPAVTSSASKKPRPSAGAQQKRSKSVGNERLLPRAVSEYPSMPDGPGNMADAIPSWTQPKKADNWDDVVLPAVARKMGLEDQYEEADGSPKAQRPASQEVIPPQPGTFGIDYSKRRSRYDPMTGEEIPLSELEKVEEDRSPVKVGNDEALRKSKRFSKMNGAPGTHLNDGHPPFNKGYIPSASPAPFAEYTRPNNLPEHDLAEQHESRSACCGCVIM